MNEYSRQGQDTMKHLEDSEHAKRFAAFFKAARDQPYGIATPDAIIVQLLQISAIANVLKVTNECAKRAVILLDALRIGEELIRKFQGTNIAMRHSSAWKETIGILLEKDDERAVKLCIELANTQKKNRSIGNFFHSMEQSDILPEGDERKRASVVLGGIKEHLLVLVHLLS